jgi:hypothetical protein
MARIEGYFPLSHGVPRVDDRRVVSGIVYVIRNGLQWKDAPKGYGPFADVRKVAGGSKADVNVTGFEPAPRTPEEVTRGSLGDGRVAVALDPSPSGSRSCFECR